MTIDGNKLAARRRVVVTLLAVALVAIVLLSADKGAVEISQSQIAAILFNKLGLNVSTHFTAEQETTLLGIRLPRIALGLLVGLALGTSGTGMQGLFRNPLADPALIGISSGAALAATAVVVIGDLVHLSGPPIVGMLIFPTAAFGGALLTSIAVQRLGTFDGRTSVTTLLLAGIAINALAQSVSGFITFFATDTQIRSLTFWKLGSLGGSSWTTVVAIAPFVVVPFLVMQRLARPMNAMLLGEDETRHLGFNVQQVKTICLVCVSLAVGASVAFTGLIAFVGLIVPHLLRLAIGPDHRFLLPASAILGALMLAAADLIARTVVAPAELPIGVLTAFVGAPFFIWLLLRDRERRLAA